MNGYGIEPRHCLLAAFAVILWAGVGICQSQRTSISTEENQAMSNTPQASRPPAPVIEPIEYDGIRYEQDRVVGNEEDQNDGYLVAVEIKTGKPLWRLKVYEFPDNNSEGVDNIGLYFRSMRLLIERNEIEVENEAGGQYIVDLLNRTSTHVSTSAPETVAPTSPKPKPMPE